MTVYGISESALTPRRTPSAIEYPHALSALPPFGGVGGCFTMRPFAVLAKLVSLTTCSTIHHVRSIISKLLARRAEVHRVQHGLSLFLFSFTQKRPKHSKNSLHGLKSSALPERNRLSGILIIRAANGSSVKYSRPESEQRTPVYLMNRHASVLTNGIVKPSATFTIEEASRPCEFFSPRSVHTLSVPGVRTEEVM